MLKYIFSILSILGLYSWGAAKEIILDVAIGNGLELRSQSFEKLSFSHQIGSIDVLNDIVMNENKHFVEIRVKGYINSGNIGEPKLPTKTELLELPQGAKVKIKIIASSYKDIPLSKQGYSFPIAPMQAPVSKSANYPYPFAFNSQIYAQNHFLPNALVQVKEIGEMRGIRLAHLIVSPFSYNPNSNVLRVYTQLSFEVVFEDADKSKTIQKKQIYKSSTLPDFSESCLNKTVFANTNNPRESGQALKYVIVSDNLYKGELQEFIAWKRQQGYEIIEAYTSDSTVGKSCESIHAYLKKLYTDATPYNTAPSYILLVGDIEQIPSFPSRLPDLPSLYNKNHVTDLYYAEYTGDYLPEAFYGRFSANTIEELRPQLHKTLAMEKLSLPSLDFMDTSLLIAGYDRTFGESHLNKQIEYAETYYFNKKEGISPLKFPYPASKDMKEDIVKAFNQGANIISYTGHGEETAWSNIGITNALIYTLKNNNKYPFVIGNCCLTGKFNSRECFAEALLRSDKKGAVAYIGASNNSYFDEDFYWTVGFTDLWEDAPYTYENTGLGIYDKLFHTHGEIPDKWAVSAAEIMTQGNLSVLESNSVLQDYYWEIYHIFGDPSYMPYKKKAISPKAVHASTILKGETVFPVQTEAFAYLALSGKNKLYGATTANAEGFAEIKLTEIPNEDSLKLHISAQFFAAYTNTILRKSASQAFVIVDSCDVLNTEGEICKIGEYNSDYALQLRLLNCGLTDAQICKLKLSSPHPSIHISDTAMVYEVLPPNASYFLFQKLPFHIDANVSDGEFIDFYIEVETNEKQSSKYMFSYLVHGSQLCFISFRIDDKNTTQRNRQLDVNENVEAYLQIQNKGQGIAKDSKLQIRSDHGFITVPNDIIEVGDLLPEESKNIRFNLASNGQAAAGNVYRLIYNFNSNGRIETLDNTGIISARIEDFEDGDFNMLAWNSEKSDWLISTESPYEGQYCACSKSIMDSEESSLEIGMFVPQDDSIHFYYKVANEEPNGMFGDFLHFFINDVSMQFYGGIIPWTKASFPVKQGNVVFKWTYQKDQSVSFDLDKAWLDLIEFPKGAKNIPIETIPQALDKKTIFNAWQSNKNEIGIEFLSTKKMKGNFYLMNILGQKICTLAQNVGMNENEKIFLTFPIQTLPNSFYICIFEGQSEMNIPTILSRKIKIQP